MPRAVSACRRRRRATHGAPLRISLFVGARHASRCFSMPAVDEGRPMGRPYEYLSLYGRGMPRPLSARRRWMKGDPWVALTNISLCRGEACLALFQHAVGGEGRPMGRPYEYLSSQGRGMPRPCFSMPAVDEGRPMGSPYEISLADFRNVRRPPTASRAASNAENKRAALVGWSAFRY